MAENDQTDDLLESRGRGLPARRDVDDGWQPPENLSDDVKARISAIQGELNALSTLIRNLGDRLGQGETEVRRDLNPAIRRERELSAELYELRKKAGFREPPQVMYGPPWRGIV